MNSRVFVVAVLLSSLGIAGWQLLHSLRVESPRKPVDDSFIAWRSLCINKAQRTIQYRRRIFNARTSSELAVCLDSDIIFLQDYALDKLVSKHDLPAKLSLNFRNARSGKIHEIAKALRQINISAGNTQFSNLLYSKLLSSTDPGVQTSALEALKDMPDELNGPLQQALARGNSDEIELAQIPIIKHYEQKDSVVLKDIVEEKDMSIPYHIQWGRHESTYDENNVFQTVMILSGMMELSNEVMPNTVNGKKSKWKYYVASELMNMFDQWNIPEYPFELVVGFKQPVEREWTEHGDNICLSLIIWLSTNLKFCYFHPSEKRIKLDGEAKSKGIASNVYRKTHPWGAKEGPNVTDPKKVPGPPGE